METELLKNTYSLLRKIGSGGYGDIYKALNVSSRSKLAIKCETSSSKSDCLYQEYKLYTLLLKNSYKKGIIPHVYDYFRENGRNYLVMDLLGRSISDIFKRNDRKFSLKTVMMLGELMLMDLEYFHSHNIIHKDVKPNNFMFGLKEDSKQLFLIDLGFAKKFIQNGRHIPFKENKGFKGTYRYSSLNSHFGYELSRRDDLESLCYVMLYLVKGVLPWQNLYGLDKNDKVEKIKKIKLEWPYEKICQDADEVFVDFLKYCRGLKFEEVPDYEYCKELFRNCLRRKGYEFDLKFCWEDENL